MRHPIENYNQEQARVLASLPDDQREFWARQFRIGNASYCYQHQFNDVAGLESNEPNEDLLQWIERNRLGNPETQNQTANELLQVYFDEYLEGLPHDGLRKAERAAGLESAKRSWPFRRYVLERNELGMDEFLKRNLSAEDYQYHKEVGKSVNNG